MLQCQSHSKYPRQCYPEQKIDISSDLFPLSCCTELTEVWWVSRLPYTNWAKFRKSCTEECVRERSKTATAIMLLKFTATSSTLHSKLFWLASQANYLSLSSFWQTEILQKLIWKSSRKCSQLSLLRVWVKLLWLEVETFSHEWSRK